MGRYDRAYIYMYIYTIFQLNLLSNINRTILNEKRQKMILKKIFFKLMNNVVFENVRKHIKLVTTERRILILFNIRTKLSY